MANDLGDQVANAPLSANALGSLPYLQDDSWGGAGIGLSAAFQYAASISVPKGLWLFSAELQFDPGVVSPIGVSGRVVTGGFSVWQRDIAIATLNDYPSMGYSWVSDIGATSTAGIQGKHASSSGATMHGSIVAVRIGLP